MSRLPAVTIGIPFYNAERFLIDAIRSVFAQTHRDWELILMDDGSSDGSLEIARSIEDPRVRVYSDGKNKKLAERLNEIHSLATHSFVARMDADDLMATDRIEKQLRFLMARPDIDLVTTGVCSITDEAVPYGIRGADESHFLTPDAVLSGKHGIIHAAVLGRREWFLRNPYNPADHWGEDYRLWVRASLKQDLSVGFIPEPLYFYREEGSANATKMLTGQRMRRQVILANGFKMVGLIRTGVLFGGSFLKSLIIWLASVAGLTGRIVRLRSPVIDPGRLEPVRTQISQIASVHIPVVTCKE